MNLNRISPSDLDLLLQNKSEFLLIDLRENYELEINELQNKIPETWKTKNGEFEIS